MSDKDHHALVEILLGIKGKAMLSGYGNPIYEPLERAGWKRYDFKVSCDVAAGMRGNRKLSKEENLKRLERVESVWIRS